MSGMVLSTLKKELRRRMLTARRQLSAAERDQYSGQIVHRLTARTEYQKAACVFCYAAMTDEVQTQAILEQMLTDGKTVCLPLITGKGVMEAVELPSMDALVTGEYGILTVRPEQRHLVDPARIDCVLVPGAAFARDGARLGMGGGYYDCFLPRAVRAQRLALAFSCQLTENIPMQERDCRMDAVLTENEWIDCKR